MTNVRGLIPMQCEKFTFEVTNDNMRYMVDLENKSSDCGI